MVVILNRLYSEVGKTQYTTLLDYNNHYDIVYIGTASPSSATSDSSWRIIKLTYTSNYDVSSAKYANGDSLFDNTWDNRSTYTYA